MLQEAIQYFSSSRIHSQVNSELPAKTFQNPIEVIYSQVNSELPAKTFQNPIEVKLSSAIFSGQYGEIPGNSKDSMLYMQALFQYRQGSFADYLSALASFFGIDCRQNEKYLYLAKSDFSDLTPLQANTGESLLVALMSRVLLYESKALDSKVYIQVINSEHFSINNSKIVQIILALNFYINVNYEGFEIRKTYIRPVDLEG